jgi:hypothetical protein
MVIVIIVISQKMKPKAVSLGNYKHQYIATLVENARRNYQNSKDSKQPLHALIQTTEAVAAVGVAEKLLDRGEISKIVRFDFPMLVADVNRHQQELIRHIESIYPKLQSIDRHVPVGAPWET